MAKLYKKVCRECSVKFDGTGPAALYCSECSQRIAKESSRRRSYNFRVANGFIKKPGVGSGGNQFGCMNSQYRRGHTIAASLLQRLRRDADVACSRCASWAVLAHHRDRDVTNNEISNIEFLCKRCHQVEHRCWENLPSK
jgi:hypothetical protein